MNLTDTHCHLQFDQYTDVAAIVDNARASGVTKLLCVGTTLEDSRQAIEIAGRFDNVWASVGIHPHDAEEAAGAAGLAEELTILANSNKVVAIGEIGLDYYKHYSDRTAQLKVLSDQLAAAEPLGLPVIFHVRDAWEDFWPIYNDHGRPKGVIHSFSATTAELGKAMQYDLAIALNGIMTFTKDDKQLAAAKAVPKEKLLLETDAPFLAPAPNRGRLCEPGFLADTARFLAGLRGETVEELAAYTTKNAERLFGL